MSSVPRAGRLLDLVGLLLFAAGATLFVWAWVGFGGVPEYVPPADAQAWAAVEVANGYWRLQKIGTGLMLGGVGVFVLAWWFARSRARSRTNPSDEHRRPDLHRD